MAKETRPSLTYKWAGGGDIATPTSSKISLGWIVEKPPVQWWNFLENRQDQALSYLYQQGIPEWDATIEYQNGSSFITYNGTLYKCIQTGTNKNPSSEAAYWTAYGGLNLSTTPVSYIEPVQSMAIRPTTSATAGQLIVMPNSATALNGSVTVFDRNSLVDYRNTYIACGSGNISIIDTGAAGTETANKLTLSANGQNNITLDITGGKVGVGTPSPTGKMDINDNRIRVRTSKTPVGAFDTGNAGEICWDSDYIYVCVATDTWKRAAIANW